MTVTVGHDQSRTRKTLTAGGQSVNYYSIPAAEAATQTRRRNCDPPSRSRQARFSTRSKRPRCTA